MVTGKQRIKVFNELQNCVPYKYMLNTGKPRNLLSKKMEVFLNPQNLITMKINESTEIDRVTNNGR